MTSAINHNGILYHNATEILHEISTNMDIEYNQVLHIMETLVISPTNINNTLYLSARDVITIIGCIELLYEQQENMNKIDKTIGDYYS